jgi:Protein kinase domain
MGLEVGSLEVPPSLLRLPLKESQGSKKLKLSCGLTEFPKEILENGESLEILDLSGNPLSELPNDFGRLQKLKIAFFSDCSFTVFPKQLAQCPSLEMVAFRNNRMTTIPEDAFPPKLRWLILTNNLIKFLPSSIGRCQRLQKCMLAGNRLVTLPDEMARCQRLALLRISANQIRELPDWLFNLPELSYLAFAGNPCSPPSGGNPTLSDISWAELSIKESLGEGASGIISKGIWNANNEGKHVAVKLFKDEVTSDGSPTDEMNACMMAGSHPHLIDPIGKIYGHPYKGGLVLQLIPAHYKNLGFSPTLQSCTRDSFLPGAAFSVEKCKNILLSIASAAAHLHSRGISHGDLYAHNILIDEHGDALLGDFGAATIYQKSHAKAGAIERLEVLAFGRLIEDMLGLLDSGRFSRKKGYLIDVLHRLHYRCTRPAVKERPLFEEIHKALNSL